VDTATHPEFRRMGIFRNLTMAALDEARADGVDLVFNTPNADSGAGYRSMGWGDVQPIGVLVRPKRPWRSKMAPGSDRSGIIESGRDPVFHGEPDRPASGLRTPRTDEYRTWRFGNHPTAGYRMVDHPDGAIVLRPNIRNRRSEVVVSELVGDVGRRAFRAAARASDAHYVACWFSLDSPERTAAAKTGYIPVPGLTTLTQVALPLTELDRDVFDSSNWDLGTGDLELL
jgi:hypothetical protein